MKQELVNLHTGMCALWVDHPLLEPDIPMNSFALIANINGFIGDGIYAVKLGKLLRLCPCTGGERIAISQFRGTVTEIDHNEFGKFVFGIVVSFALPAQKT